MKNRADISQHRLWKIGRPCLHLPYSTAERSREWGAGYSKGLRESAEVKPDDVCPFGGSRQCSPSLRLALAVPSTEKMADQQHEPQRWQVSIDCRVDRSFHATWASQRLHCNSKSLPEIHIWCSLELVDANVALAAMIALLAVLRLADGHPNCLGQLEIQTSHSTCTWPPSHS